MVKRIIFALALMLSAAQVRAEPGKVLIVDSGKNSCASYKGSFARENKVKDLPNKRLFAACADAEGPASCLVGVFEGDKELVRGLYRGNGEITDAGTSWAAVEITTGENVIYRVSCQDRVVQLYDPDAKIGVQCEAICVVQADKNVKASPKAQTKVGDNTIDRIKL